MSVAIVTDSTSDIEPELAAALGIEVVPLFVVWGSQSLRDYVDLSRRDFYARLRSDPVLPTTSQPSSEMFAQAFERALSHAGEVVCLVISSKLSGTINAATAAAARFDGRITVVDSESAAGGLGMMALHANELAGRGDSRAAILAAIERERATQRLFACVPDLSHLNRTGRIGKARQLIGTLMRIVPVLSLSDGAVVPLAQVRTFARAQESMIDLALRSVPEPGSARFLVMHTDAPQLAENVRERLLARLPSPSRKLKILEAGPVIGTHAGPGAVGVFCSQE